MLGDRREITYERKRRCGRRDGNTPASAASYPHWNLGVWACLQRADLPDPGCSGRCSPRSHPSQQGKPRRRRNGTRGSSVSRRLRRFCLGRRGQLLHRVRCACHNERDAAIHDWFSRCRLLWSTRHLSVVHDRSRGDEMRRLIRRISSNVKASKTTQDSQRGAVSVMVAVLLVALLGTAALAVDVGAMYAEKAQIQNGADSSALAIATDCANGDCGDYEATGMLLANANANDSSTGVSSISFPGPTTVRVETNAREAGSGNDHFSLFFARVMGFETAEIAAAAEASWGAPSAATTLPWTISQCVFETFLSPSQLTEFHSTGDFTGDPIPTRILLRYDQNVPTFPGCEAQNGYAPGGFGWLDLDNGCSTDIDIANQEVGSNPGNDFPNICNSILPTLRDEPVLIPVFTEATKNGQKTRYELSGFLAFQITGFKLGGGPTLTQLDPLAPNCEGGNCRGIQGYFTRFVSIAEGISSTGGVPNFGATSVSLTK